MRRLEKRKIKKRIYSWWTVIILGGILVFSALNVWDVYKKYAESKNNISGLQDRYASSQDRKVDLDGRIEYLHSERGVEEEIREKFNVAKDGEQVIVIVDQKPQEDGVVETNENPIRRFWSTIFDFFR